MCLAVPAKIISVGDFYVAEVDIMGNTRKISTILTPHATIGSWVLIHAGQAINVISDEEAKLTLAMWEELLRAEE